MKFNINLLETVLLDYYNLKGDIQELAGDVDYNFLVKDGGRKYLLKICKPDVPLEEVDFQIELLKYMADSKFTINTPKIIKTEKGSYLEKLVFEGDEYILRLHSWVEGRMLSELVYRSPQLLCDWGAACGQLSKALKGFDHKGGHRMDKWNPMQVMDCKSQFEYFENKENLDLAQKILDIFTQKVIPIQENLRMSINYSDAHEHNILLNSKNEISGIIDFGDAIYAPTICELAIACAYAGMWKPNPIEAIKNVVKGYHNEFPILEIEIEVLFPLILSRLLITVSNAAQNKYIEPDNEYLQISAKPAWDLLRLLAMESEPFVHYVFRSAIGLKAHPGNSKFQTWVGEHRENILDPIELANNRVEQIDLSVGSLDLGNNSNFETIREFENTIERILEESDADIGIGGYGEIRPFYTTDSYKVEGNNGPQWRTMHLGKDYWTKSATAVRAIYDGQVVSVQNNDAFCDYGPTIILKHRTTEDQIFYSLYGHLTLSSMDMIRKDEHVTAGQKIGEVGTSDVNGGWPPHLHFQLMLDLLGKHGDFPGVGYVSESDVWLSICPSLEIDENEKRSYANNMLDEIVESRQNSLGKSLSLSYEQPLHMVRGYGQYLYSTTGRRYLDTVNNVAHVGHEHKKVVRAASRQAAILNTNTRYLHKNIVDYAKKILSKCPVGLDVVYFVNSGSEANELAIRMAKTYSNQRDMLALEAGYHGNTGACVDVSSYKFDGNGGKGAPEYTSVVPMPDIYRGVYKDQSTAGKLYAAYISEAVEKLKSKGRNVAGFICESILSCAGQIVLPENYLKEAFKIVRAEGGLCIADEVQVGFGRVGEHYWGYQLQDVVPDIVTCGKPIGNGHPLGAVITSRKVADAFTNGMEYFNTYGGNPVSCAVGLSILEIIEDEELQNNAKKVGRYLFDMLKDLQLKYSIIGDVRGIGFFCGIELVRDLKTLEPADKEATYLVNRMREQGILMSTDGPLHNVIKMKPPMCFTRDNVNELILRLDRTLKEIEVQFVR